MPDLKTTELPAISEPLTLASLLMVVPDPDVAFTKKATLAEIFAAAALHDVAIGELVIGAIDGVNTVFTTSGSYRAQSLMVWLNGLRQARTIDYTETSDTTFSMLVAPIPGDVIIVDYFT